MSIIWKRVKKKNTLKCRKIYKLPKTSFSNRMIGLIEDKEIQQISKNEKLVAIYILNWINVVCINM